MGKFFDFEILAEKAPLFVWIYVAVVIAILIDLFTALHYAKRNGVPIASWGLRKTVDKMVRYYGVVLMGTTIDIILYLCNIYEQLGFFTAPYATAFFAILLCSIEVKSVFEHRDPEKRKMLKKASESLFNGITKRDAETLLRFITEGDKDNKDNKTGNAGEELTREDINKIKQIINEHGTKGTTKGDQK